jgi:DNA-binding transcriptional MerR regulator
LTVRALHHFDEIGLLRPSQRSAAGHRRYTEGDVERLYRVLALRALGVPLREIDAALDGDDLAGTVRRQLGHVEREIGVARRLRRRLLALSAALREAPAQAGGLQIEAVMIETMIKTMEDMVTGSPFTPEQLTELKARHHGAGGAPAVARWRERWAAMAAEVREHLAAGARPADPAVLETARRWSALMDEMTGGDRAAAAGIYTRVRDRGPEVATSGAVDAEVWEFMTLVFATGFGAAAGCPPPMSTDH